MPFSVFVGFFCYLIGITLLSFDDNIIPRPVFGGQVIGNMDYQSDLRGDVGG